MHFRFTVLLALGLCLVACAKGKERKSEMLPVRNTMTLEEAQTLARRAQVSCLDSCLPAVGLLTMAGPYDDGFGAGQCTASLIDEDTLLTNGHCLPQDLISAGDSCRDRIWITFPAHPGHSEYDRQIGCETVIQRRRESGPNGADYAYLKLQRKSNRPPLRLSRDGVEHGKTYSLAKVDPARGTSYIGGLLRTVNCSAVHDSAIFKGVRDNLSSDTMLADCNVIPGNSGSPVLASDGTVRGVIYAYLKKDAVKELFESEGAIVPTLSEIADLNLATNLACLPSPSDLSGRALPSVCSGIEDRLASASHSLGERLAREVRNSVAEQVAASAAPSEEISAFRWGINQIRPDRFRDEILALPDCVQPRGNQYLGREFSLTRPRIALRAILDRHLRARYVPTVAGWNSEAELLLLENYGASSSFVVRISDLNRRSTFASTGLTYCL